MSEQPGIPSTIEGAAGEVPRAGVVAPPVSPPSHLGRLAASARIEGGREIFRLAAPTMVAMLSHTLMWTVDTILLGHYSSLALAASGLGGMIVWTGYSLFNNLNRISTTFVAQAHGRDDREAIGDYVWQGIWIALATGLVLTAMGWFSGPALPLTRNPPEVLSLTYVYIRWRSVSAVFTQLHFCLSGYFQGRGEVRIPMWAGIAGNVVNVVLDIWLIFGWSGVEIAGRRWLAMEPMGVAGGAIATSCGVLVSFVWLAAPAFGPRARALYRLHRPRRPSRRKIRDLVRIGAPSAWDGFADMASFMMFSVLIGTSGAVQLAASQITIQMLAFSFMPMWGLTVAGSILMGNAIGAGAPDRAARQARQVYKLGIYYAALLGLLYLGLREHIFAVFTDDPAVLVLGSGLALVAALFQVGDGMRMLSVGLLSGAGDTRYPMLVSVTVLWGVFVPLTWLLTVRLDYGVTEGWIGGTVCYLLIAALLMRRFRSGAWRKMRIFSGTDPELRPH